ncbi:MAG: adenylyl-sulfate kinase [Planctomycetota bacterium]
MSEKQESDGVSSNVVWHGGSVDASARAERLGQTGATLWFTGLSGSGKSTVAVAAEAELFKQGRVAYRLDGDNVRHGLCGDLGFSEADRSENLRRVAHVAALMADAGLIVLCSFVSPFKAGRDAVAEVHASAGVPFYEVYVDVPLDVAESRDPKGLYEKARAGQIKDFTGIHQAFEAPESPALRLPTHELAVEQSVERVVGLLKDEGVVPV